MAMAASYRAVTDLKQLEAMLEQAMVLPPSTPLPRQAPLLTPCFLLLLSQLEEIQQDEELEGLLAKRVVRASARPATPGGASLPGLTRSCRRRCAAWRRQAR